MTNRTGLALSLLLSSLALGACGGDDGPGSGPLSESEFRALCQTSCEHRKECDATVVVADCVASCVTDFPELGWARGDAMTAIVECQAEESCSATVNTCMTECSPTGAHESFETRCRAFSARCDLDAEGCEVTPMPVEGNDDVGLFCLFLPSIMDEMTACIPDSAECQAGITCVQGVIERHNINL